MSVENNVVKLVTHIAKAMGQGRDLIEEPTRNGGLLVDDEVLALAADMELVASQNYGGDFTAFNADLILEIGRAQQNGDDPIEEVRLWLDDFLAAEEMSA